MSDWRKIFNLGTDPVTFNDVHTAFRRAMVDRNMTLEEMVDLTRALEVARKELGDSGKGRIV